MTDEAFIINNLISDLINKSLVYKNKVKKRLNVTKIFTEFENKAAKEFYNYIHDSNFRYKGMKSGNLLNSVVNRSKTKASSYNDRVLTDNFYIAYNIDDERKRMRELGNKKESEEIRTLITSVMKKTNSLLRNKKNPRHEDNEESTHQTTWTNKNNKNAHQRISKVTSGSEQIDSEYRLMMNKDILLTQFNIEESHMNEGIEKYKEQLHSIENDLLSPHEEANKTLKSLYYLNKLKMLTYKKIEKEKKPDPNKGKGLKGDINYWKIVKFSKASLNTGNPPQTEEEIKESLVKLPLTHVDYSNTKDIVLTQASTANELDQRIAKKEKLIDEYLQSTELPPISEYQSIIYHHIISRYYSRKISTRELIKKARSRKEMHVNVQCDE